MADKDIKSTKRNEIANKVQSVVQAYLSEDRINTDPNGSYTGRPEDPYEKPIQDADDL